MRLFWKKPPSNVVVPDSVPVQSDSRPSEPGDPPHSPSCTARNEFNLKTTSYMEREDLETALAKLFAQYGELEFGVMERSQRWTFWTPRAVKWPDLRYNIGMSNLLMPESGAGQCTTPNTSQENKDRWTDYFGGLLDDYGDQYYTVQLQERLEALSGQLFSDKTMLHVVDAFANKTFKAESSSVEDSTATTKLLGELPDLRIISIIRENSISPLWITKVLLSQIVLHHSVGPSFLDLLFGFRPVEEISEKGSCRWSPLRSTAHGHELCYSFKYVEKNNRKHGVKYSERQLGVYHSSGSGHDVMILIHANPYTKARSRLEQKFSENRYKSHSFLESMMLHAYLISTYLDNWRWCLDEDGTKCIDTESRLLTTGLRHKTLTFMELQELRNVESRLLSEQTILKATRSLLMHLRSATKSLESQSKSHDNSASEAFGLLLCKCEGYLLSVDVIKGKIAMLTQLLADGLNQQSQETSAAIADSTYILTKKSVNDNAIVRVVTVITLIYLPTQFVATFFGMNFMRLPDQTNNILIANDWWIFLATALPLTGLTLFFLVIAMLVEGRKRSKQDQRRIRPA